MFLRVSWGLTAVWMLALMGGGSIPCISGQQKASVMARMGPTGIWSAGAGTCTQSKEKEVGTEWRSCFIAGSAGWSQGSLMTTITVAQGLDVGLGVSVAKGGPIQLLFGGADGLCGWQLEVPLVQPVAQPWGLTCWGGCHVDFASRSGVVQAQWKPGHFPEVWLSLRTANGECTVGTGGLSWTWTVRDSGRFPWRFSIGLMRANLPWAGLDGGGTAGMGLDVGRWMALQWMRS